MTSLVRAISSRIADAGEPGEQRVGPGVVADDMAVVGHLAQQVRVGVRHLAAHEEHRADVVLAQGAQDVRGVAGVGAVVEGQHHACGRGRGVPRRNGSRRTAARRGAARGRAVPGHGLQAVRGGPERGSPAGGPAAAAGGGARPRAGAGGPVAVSSGGGARRGGRPSRPAATVSRCAARRADLILRHDSSVATAGRRTLRHRCGGTETPDGPSRPRTPSSAAAHAGVAGPPVPRLPGAPIASRAVTEQQPHQFERGTDGPKVDRRRRWTAPTRPCARRPTPPASPGGSTRCSPSCTSSP